MEKKKFKLTDRVMFDLSSRAKKLPKVTEVDGKGQPRTIMTQVLGDRLTQDHMQPGQILKPNLTYSVREFILVDHFKTMKEIYRDRGPGGVDDYEQATMALQHYSVKKLKNKSWTSKFGEWLLKTFSKK